MKNIAVILAGGSGSRLGADRPKQFLSLKDGRTVLETCVDAFHQNEHIDELAIVMLRDHIAEAQALLPADRFPKIKYWIPGGAERWESSKNAVEAIYLVQQKIGFPEENINVLLHDCARPFISQALITKVCEALETHEAVSVAVPVTDTIYVVENSESETVISEVPSRAVFRRAQTPQAFRLSVLKEAYSIFNSPPETGTFEAQWASMVAEDCEARRGEGVDPPLHATDDAGVVRYCLPDIPIHILPGEESNRKITYKEDIV